MSQTVTEKIVQAHAEGLTEGQEVRAGDMVTVRPFHILTHDNTGAILPKFRAIGAEKVADPSQPVYALDHAVQDTSDKNLAKYASIEAFAREQGIVFHPAGAGIGHQLMVENGFVHPGSLVVASDSHSNMYGALAAVGTPVVRTDAAAIWATGRTWWLVPRTVKVTFTGELQPGVSGKDVILTLCGLYNKGEALNAAVEFHGAGGLSMAERLTISNMSTEWGALVGWFPVDDVTLEWLASRKEKLADAGSDRITDADLESWRSDPPAPDPDAAYAGRIVLDLAQVPPYVAGPHVVQAARPLAEVEAEEIPVHKAYLLSCVNARVEDFEAGARALQGRRIADGVELYIAAASQEIQAEAERRGAWQALLDAGATALPPSCGPCIGLGTGLLDAGQVGISATNRNFKGRMGSRDARCFLGSPAVVVASAVAGRIAGPEPITAEPLVPSFEALDAPAPAAAEVEIVDGFPARITGRLVLLPQDNLNTDGIYGKDYTYREDMTPEMMARVVFENYDPAFPATVGAGDVGVGGFNFGTGSSREQAVTALQAAGIPLVVAATFSQTYLRNAFNNGFPCIASSAFVEHVRAALAEAVAAGERTIVPGDEVEVDFASGTLTWRGERFAFPPLGPVPQGLVAAGGVENQVRQTLGLS